MSEGANPARGEAALAIAGETLVLRPSFAALVAAEQELGPLFALVERAAAGELRLAELAGLFWHCLRDRPDGLTRNAFGEAIVAGGLARATPALRGLLSQILQGR
ncbi:gene transfer agent family protein [Sphingomonas sp. 1P06PA]|uniref:gene transfer agent family protein n=1 Tax=Sphingomonas sp. 1P06PA TaxID=554121 RepID=UPI0039A5014F